MGIPMPTGTGLFKLVQNPLQQQQQQQHGASAPLLRRPPPLLAF